ncbi:SDR family oxidoreductase [soil metagenome]
MPALVSIPQSFITGAKVHQLCAKFAILPTIFTMRYKLSEQYPKKRAFITGAGSGLGHAFALALAADGWKLGLADIKQDRLEAVCSQVEELGGQAYPFGLDVSDKKEYTQVANEMARHVGIDLLINNAGVGDGSLFKDYSLENWEWMVGINQMGVIYGTHLFLPGMIAQGGGQIINIASAAAFSNAPMMTAYNATKAAVLSLSETLYVELKADNIKVSVALPLFFKTNLMDESRGGEEVKHLTHLLMETAQLEPDKVAHTILTQAGKGTFRIYVPFQSRIIHWFSRVFPNIFLLVKQRMAGKREEMKARLEKKYAQMKK